MGGIENHVKALAEVEAANGNDVTVLVTNTTLRTERSQVAGVQIIKAGRIGTLASTPLSPALLVEARKLRPDIVNLHMPYPPGDLAIRAVGDNPTLVVTYHSDIVRQRRLLQCYKPLLHATLRRASRIIVTSNAYLRSSPFLRAYANKCRVVPLSVDHHRIDTFDADLAAHLRTITPTPLLLAVSVLRYYKGLHILLYALPQIDAGLIIVGAGPEQSNLKALAAKLGIEHRVHFAGHVPEVASYYHAADLFVLPSHLRSEAFGIVLLEAMAAGLPLVTTEIGTGTSEVNQHGRTGFVVPPNDPDALARAINVLLRNETLRHTFGRHCRELAQTLYTSAHLYERTQNVYREALADRAAPVSLEGQEL